MKKILTILLCVFICIGAVGASFALAKHLDTAPSTSLDESSSEDETNDGGDVATEGAMVWELCTDEDDLAVGDKIIIVAMSRARALGVTQNSNNRSSAKLLTEEDPIIISEDVQIITLEEGVVENSFAFYVDTGYLYAASSTSNHLRTKDVIDENASWVITINEDCAARIVAQGTNAINVLQYNAGNHIFSCYTSAQEAVVIYRLLEESES